MDVSGQRFTLKIMWKLIWYKVQYEITCLVKERRGSIAPAIMRVPKTTEDSPILNRVKYWRLFGQNDHVRLYAHDGYVARIGASGFKVHQLDESYFGKWLFKKLGLKSSSILYVVSKP